MSKQNSHTRRVMSVLGSLLVLCFVVGVSFSEQGKKNGAAKSDLTGRYEGTAKDNTDQLITVALDLAEKDGAITGTISSSHGDFSISKGSLQGDVVTLEFDADGTTGTISLKRTEDKLTGSWTAGDQGGPIDVKKVAAQQAPPKEKS
jgi:hypothetical protein